MEDKHLYPNPSKCAFGIKEYLGQFVAHEGFEVDTNKIQFMMEWIVLKNLKNIRWFLWLMGYHTKFVKNYSKIETPLTMFSKEEEFLVLEKEPKDL